jgi:hypothetical protein
MTSAIRSRPDLLLGLGGRPEGEEEGALGQEPLKAEKLKRGPAYIGLNNSVKK